MRQKYGHVQMIFVGYLIALLFIVLAGIVLLYSWNTIAGIWGTGLTQTSVLQLAQIATAFIGAIAAAILTATIGRSNEYLKAQLSQSVNSATEELKAKLALETGRALETHRGNIAQAIALATERLKADLTQAGDTFRAELSQLAPRRHAAYHAMWAALVQYFRALQKFEAGVFDTPALEAAEKACADATGLTLLVEEEDDTSFHQFWQDLTHLFESGEPKKDSPDGLKDLWRSEGRRLGLRYAETKAIFGAKLRA